jgi:aromatic-L-amino-acid decarboxylase
MNPETGLGVHAQPGTAAPHARQTRWVSRKPTTCGRRATGGAGRHVHVAGWVATLTTTHPVTPTTDSGATSMTTPLEPSRPALVSMGHAAVEFVADLCQPPRPEPHAGSQHLPPRPPEGRTSPPVLPGPEPGDLTTALRHIADAAADSLDHRNPQDFAAIPSGGLFTGAVGEFLARGLNRFTGLPHEAPGLVAQEHAVIRWLCDQFGLPAASAGGISTTGASLAALTALVAAREHQLGEQITTGVLYVGENTHFSLRKAARIAGLPTANVRVIPAAADLTMDPRALHHQIRRDLAAGWSPFCVVATAGSTDTGAIDPIEDIAAVAAQHSTWLHVDASYGGWFILTDRGRQRLAGVQAANSIALDAHKTLSLPFGSANLLVRDTATLRAAFTATGPYLSQDVDRDPRVPDYAALGMELTREYRGLRLWLPLYVHGLDAITAMLDERLDLAAQAHTDLTGDPLLELPWPPALSTVVFRPIRGHATDLLDHIHATSAVRLSATTIAGRDLLRMCVLSHHTAREHVHAALAAIHAAVRDHTRATTAQPVPAV